MACAGRASVPDTFGQYANIYDFLYEDKDYEAECDYLVRILTANGVRPGGSVLDLGCGTGGHALPLAARGYTVLGIDRSPKMIARARAKSSRACPSAEFQVGDVRNLELNRSFDAAIAMFAVISYQCTNDDLHGMLSSARRHLSPGGLLIFDSWFGPAVLAQQPEEKTKTVTIPGGGTITRTAKPSLDLVTQTVKVDYEVTRESVGQIVEKIFESHTVRFLFPQEILLLLDHAGFELAALGPFMDPENEATTADWNVSVVAKAD